MYFATVPCCCAGCACYISSEQLGGDLAVSVDSGTLSGTSTSSLSGTLSVTDDCLLEVHRRMLWQVKNFMLNLPTVRPNSTLTWVHSGNGTDDLTFEVTKNGNTACTVLIYIGATELTGGGVSFDPGESFSPGARLQWQMCISPGGASDAWAKFGTGGGPSWKATVDGFTFIPGDTVTWSWDLVGTSTGPLAGVTEVQFHLDHPGCPEPCTYE